MSGSYRIPDEPRPGALAHLVVNPVWPLFGLMFGGAWLAWPWFAFNGYAVGSPTRHRELATVLAGLVGSAVVLFGGAALLESVDARSHLAGRFLALAVVLWKIGVAYAVFFLQARTFELHQHYGGIVRNGMIVIAAAFFLRPKVLAALPILLQVILR